MPLVHAQILIIEGRDALAFAHAQFASDVHALGVDRWQWSTWLDPRGRVRMLMQIMRTRDDELRLLLHGGSADVMTRQLQRYVLRNRVAIHACEPRSLGDAPARHAGELRHEADALVLDMGGYALRVDTRSPATQRWRLAAIDHGHPWLPDALLDMLLAPALSLARLGAVRLDKGCYPGQEIVARLHYRGGSRQQLWRLQGDAPLPPGGVLACGGQPVGHILDSAGDDAGACRALAVVRDTATQADAAITCEEAPARIRLINEL